MNAKLSYHWEENIKPALGMMLIGVLIVIGFRVGEMLWPRPDTRVLICFSDDIGKITECTRFEPREP